MALRELIKLASLASVIAEAGIAVFKTAFERWTKEADEPDLPRIVAGSLDELKAVTSGA